MDTEAPPHTSITRRIVAALVLVAAVAIAIKIVIGLVMTVVWVALGLLVAAAVLWALKTLVW
jgi:hypothetical protein